MPRHAHHDPVTPACCSCCCGCAGAPPCYYPAPAPAPPSSAASDQLLHAIAAHLLLSSPAPAQPQPQPQPQPPPPPPPAAQPATNPYPYPYPHPQQYQYQYQQQQEEAKHHAYSHPPPPPPQQQQQLKPNDHGHLLLHSLLRRVAAIESALPRCFPAPPPARRPPHPNSRPRRAASYHEEEEEQEEEDESEQESPPSPPPPRARRPARTGPPSAANDRAARTIQAYFRRFLARRSRTLRQLKDLAVLRSKAAAIRGSLSGRRGVADPAAVSEAAMGLLLRLDAIQGGDPMIREGRRAVSRELTRILEFVDKVLIKEQQQMAMGDALETHEYHEGCSAALVAGRPPSVRKKVSFSGNGQVHTLNGKAENGIEVDDGSEGSSSAESDEVKPSKRSTYGGKPGLAAPMPVHMESRPVASERR